MARERLFAQSEGDDEVDKTLTFLREPTDLEITETKRAFRVFRPFGSESPLAGLTGETRHLSESIEVALATRGTADMLEAGKAIHRQFGIWLSSFRACADRTPYQLSQGLGKTNPAYQRFEELTSREYDQNFAYRLCTQLRNVDQHVGQVINAIRMDFKEGEGDDDIYTLVTQINPQLLASTFRKKIKAPIRAELTACERNLEPIRLVRGALLSWNRIYCDLLQAAWDEIRPLVDLCTALHQEAVAAGGVWAVFIDAPEQDLSTVQWSIRHNPYDQAELIGRKQSYCQQTLSESPPVYPPEAFTEDGEPPELSI